ncbi:MULTISPECIES: FAD binding domain-containing protein [unclassified Chelatococcus]|uniref:FAD binding domain-containing protein n=1 Tax=unclassified Chelatococcus TaxID=2638111 RepID=UPI001BD126F7|nr:MULTISPECIES: FAD binding domain-containing protein [unclassified Chelatococcus]MBS7700454.1 FAD binding domain-containing protein [Chelatococcus sp. YT9]MBX3556250.1 FAD binding domain-containing protein [Chelatococcus sp.]
MTLVPDYIRARSVAEAAEALRAAEGGGILVAGGTIIASLINQHLAEPSTLIDISPIETMKSIRVHGDGKVELGALVTHEQVRRSADIQRHLPLMAEIAKDISSWRLRNRGTLGGSICTMGGQGDPATGLIALGAQLVLSRGHGQRTIPIESFYKDGFSLDLAEDEILETVLVPPVPQNAHFAFGKEGPRNAMDWTQLTVSVVFTEAQGRIETTRIGVNGAAATALRARGAEEALTGSALDAIDWKSAQAALAAEISPETDLVYSADFKRHLAGVLLKRAVNKALGTAPRQENIV